MANSKELTEALERLSKDLLGDISAKELDGLQQKMDVIERWAGLLAADDTDHDSGGGVGHHEHHHHAAKMTIREFPIKEAKLDS